MAAAAATALLLRCMVTTLLLPSAIAAFVYGDIVIDIPLNNTERFLYLQNRARADVGVAPLAWDGTVAAYAERYAAAREGDCDLKHSNGPYGENIFWGSAGANWTATDAVASWASEKQFYNCSDDSCAAGLVCTHYKQMVWAKTTKVGCASVSCDANRGTFMVCEYDPPGNVPGVQAYAGCGHFNQTDHVW
uniref:SCP domain-containing protein n=1 Tax=Oryza glumipatula TaxID=40148 RepID=A0A0D9YS59_9ORYZ